MHQGLAIVFKIINVVHVTCVESKNPKQDNIFQAISLILMV